MRYDVIVAGGGIAGLTAALFLARGGLRVAVFDQAESSLRRVARVNNYTGFADGISGAELLDRARLQAVRQGAEVFDERVEAARRDGDAFAVSAASGERICTFFLIASNKRTDLARALGLELGGFGSKFVVTDATGATAVEGVYAAGRITGKPSQAVISAGDGAAVAIALIQRIRGAYYVDHDT
jgi:thioredoxin reductase (NADPH)